MRLIVMSGCSARTANRVAVRGVSTPQSREAVCLLICNRMFRFLVFPVLSSLSTPFPGCADATVRTESLLSLCCMDQA